VAMSLFQIALDPEYGDIMRDTYRFGGALLIYHIIATMLGAKFLGGPLFGGQFVEVATCLLLTILAYHLVYTKILTTSYKAN
jgi:hypothetical protein